MPLCKSARKESVQRRREILQIAMGGRCEYCGSREKLEFHHTQPREWVASRVNQMTRQAQYEQEFLEGILQLTCATCNKRLGKPLDLPERKEDEVPF